MEKKESHFLGNTAKAAAFAAASFSTVPEAVHSESHLESIEKINQHSESFATDIAAEEAFIGMHNGALYLDAEGNPVAIVEAAIINETNPGKGFSQETAHGVTEGYAKAWKEEALKLAQSYSKAEIATVRYNWQDIQNAISNPNESMYPERIHSIEDIVFYFGDKEVRDGGGLSRIEYLQQHLQFRDELPQALQDELRFLAPGIAGEESRFRSDIKSSVHAGGVFQFMPATVEGLGYKQFVIYKNEKPYDLSLIPYTEQVELLGQHMSNIYQELFAHVDINTMDSIRQFYASDEDFYKFFVTPCIINAYNTGAGRMAYAIKAYATPDRFQELSETFENNAGYDLFDDMVAFAESSDQGLLSGYQEASASYTQKVYAYARIIAKEYPAYKHTYTPYTVAAK